ncbi:MAG: chitobiase/beta-hexosaminidase C-terminal domain-containing protein [Candidatus Cloacimonadales bacterium]
MYKKLLILLLVSSMLFLISCDKDKSTKPTHSTENPTFNPASGVYNQAQVVEIICVTPDADVRYTLDESDPTELSQLYDTPINITETTTLKAKAYKANYLPSEIVIGNYSIYSEMDNPTFNPAPGIYNQAQSVEIICTTPNANIRYTINGTNPTESSQLYNNPINISTTKTLKARAFKTNYLSSEIVSGTYTIDIPEENIVATPIFNPAPGVYNQAQSVEIMCTTPNANIRYTINGNNPTESSQLYNNPINISSTKTLKARAFKTDYLPSEIVSGTYTIDENINPEMILVPGGNFTMGRATGDGHLNELPTHQVTLSPFSIGKYEVTQSEYQTIMGTNPAQHLSCGIGDNYPVYWVNWYNAVEYCNARSIQEGLTPCYDTSDWSCNFNANGYRLPTEAEWEYAARGATNNPDYLYSGSDDIASVAWYNGNNEPYGTKPVGTKAPNSLGVYDMSGNVWEWCNDWHSSYSSDAQTDPIGPATGSGRVSRGGSWSNSAAYCRVAGRSRNNPSSSNLNLGFRVARSSE